jgi:Tat protein secretion system quality control protein TatD with DNase activity
VENLHNGMPVMLIDIGANLNDGRFQQDIAQVLQRARDTGVSTVIVTVTVTGTTEKQSQTAYQLTRSFPRRVYSTE